MQEESGIDVVTDGEFRRRDFRTGFDAVDGMTMRSWDMPWHGREGVTKLRSGSWCGFASIADGGKPAEPGAGVREAPAGRGRRRGHLGRERARMISVRRARVAGVDPASVPAIG
jgi:hypothetical protein